MRVFDELTRRAPRVVMRVASGAGRLQETTRDEVLELAERGSRGLRALGVGPGDRVAVRMERGKWQTSAFLAAWCIGACVVPLFELLGSEALAARLEQSGAKLQLDRSSWEPLARGEGEMAGAAPEGTFEWDAPLALLFTSGTTGRPKGVAVTPRSLASTEAYLSHGLALQSGEETRFCNASDPAWAYGLYYNLLGPLWSGATVHHLAVNAPLTALTDLKLTDLAAAPSFYGLLSRADVNLPDLHRCSSAGESMGSALHARWKERYGVAVREHYGQTEHGMLLGNWQRDGSDSDPSSLGTALPGQNLDFGENGELLVRKDGPLFWFQGYWGLPAPEGDSIATGDLFRKLPDGTHRYCGRGDDLIKASGLRIGPSEVEAAVMARGGDWGVAECAAVPVGFGGGVAVGVVLVCRSGHSGPTLEEVRAQVERTVGGHAMPRRLLVVHEPLPRTLSGKLLRKPLAALFK